MSEIAAKPLDSDFGLPPNVTLPDEEEIILPASTKELLSVAQVRKAYEEDETLLKWQTEFKITQEEYQSLAPNIRDMESMLARLKRNRGLVRHKAMSLSRRIRTRKKFLIQRLFDKVLTDVRRNLGITKKVKLDNFRT